MNAEKDFRSLQDPVTIAQADFRNYSFIENTNKGVLDAWIQRARELV